MGKLSDWEIKEIRDELKKALSSSTETKPIKIDIDGDILKEILFERYSESSYGAKNALIPAINWELIKKIDLSNVDFSEVRIVGLDFNGSSGVIINPQTIADRNLSNTKLSGVTLDGPFYNAYIRNTDFTGSKGAVINPQSVCNTDLSDCKFYGVKFDGPFDGAIIKGADFTGSLGATINPQSVYNKNLSNCKFYGVTFNGPFDGALIFNSDFTGSKGAIIDPQTIHRINMDTHCILKDAIVVDDFNGPKCERWDFTGCYIIPTNKPLNGTYINVLKKVRAIK